MVVDTTISVPGSTSPIVATAMSQVFEVYSAKDFVSPTCKTRYSSVYVLTVFYSQGCQPVHLSRMLSDDRGSISQQRKASRAEHQKNLTTKIAEMSIDECDNLSTT